MTLQSIVKQIKEKSVAANDNLEDATNNTRPMREGNKKAAKEHLTNLKNEYRLLLLSSSTFVVVTGSHAEELSKLTNSENKSFSADSEDLYRKIVSKIDSRAYMNQTIASSILNNIGNALEEIAVDIGVNEYPQLRYRGEYSQKINHEGQFLELVKHALNDSLGGEMVGIYAANSILEEALKREHSESFTPILLTTTDEQLAVTLSKDLKNLTKNVFVVSVGKTPRFIKNMANSISIKEASPEALEQLLEEIKTKTA